MKKSEKTYQTPLEEDLLKSWEDIKNGDIEVIDDDYINQIIEHAQKREFYTN